MLEIKGVGIGLRTEERELTHVLPGDRILFYRSMSDNIEVWTFGFCRGCKSLYFLDGDKKRFLTSSVSSRTLDDINYKKRRFIVEMLCGVIGCDFEEIPSSYNIRKYVFVERK